LKLVLISLAMTLLPEAYIFSNAPSARPQSKMPVESKTASKGDDPALSSSPSYQKLPKVEQKAREPIIILYQNGNLTIDALNAPLSDILRAVCLWTGALINVPSEANERVTIQIGPEKIINVLGSLLNESRFNYAIEELSVDQGAPVQVTLFLKGIPTRARQPIDAATAEEIQPEADAARKTGIAERSQLIRQIAGLRIEIMEEGLKDKERP
jgi:hypothetical protein